MPTLDVPQDSDRQRLSRPVGPTSRTRPSAVASEIVSTLGTVDDGIGDAAGNSVDDHLASLKNAVDDAGTDLSDLTVTARTPVDGDAILELLADGTTQFNRTLITMLLAAQTESDVTALIDTQIARLATNARWKGNWTPADYDVGDYVFHTNYYAVRWLALLAMRRGLRAIPRRGTWCPAPNCKWSFAFGTLSSWCVTASN